MSISRRTVVAAVAATALGATMVASTAPADAHTYTKEGTASAKEARKLFKEVFNQKCLTVHEARHIVQGNGQLGDETYGEDSYRILSFRGTGKSHIVLIELSVEGRCVTSISAVKR